MHTVESSQFRSVLPSILLKLVGNCGGCLKLVSERSALVLERCFKRLSWLLMPGRSFCLTMPWSRRTPLFCLPVAGRGFQPGCQFLLCKDICRVGIAALFTHQAACSLGRVYQQARSSQAQTAASKSWHRFQVRQPRCASVLLAGLLGNRRAAN